MRIGISGHFWPYQTVGSGQYLRHLVRELGRLETEHELLLIGEQGGLKDPPAIPSVELPPGPVPAGRPAKLWFEQIALPRAAGKLDLDVLHVPYLGAPLFSPVPTVVTIHDLIPLLLPHYRGSRRKRAYTWLAVQAARRARLLIAVSEHTRQDTVRCLGYPTERIYVTHEAASGLEPASAEQIAAVRQKYDLPQRFVLYLGDCDRRKGVHRLLQVFAHWREQSPQPDVTLVLAGPRREADGTLFFDLAGLSQQLGVAEHVQFLGPVEEEDKGALYSAATVFAFLSEYEGFGLPPLEAMACGTAVLAGDSSSVSEVVGSAGVLVKPGDLESALAALTRLLQDVPWREELQRRGIERAAQFSWAKTARQTLSVYEKMLSP
ncbi:MAG: glycosyltransferase family 4 protein [Chloroflexia bacterium]|nr:glycosyltransferase family 4 protein [Chloroflexia bacterium]